MNRILSPAQFTKLPNPLDQAPFVSMKHAVHHCYTKLMPLLYDADTEVLNPHDDTVMFGQHEQHGAVYVWIRTATVTGRSAESHRISKTHTIYWFVTRDGSHVIERIIATKWE